MLRRGEEDLHQQGDADRDTGYSWGTGAIEDEGDRCLDSSYSLGSVKAGIELMLRPCPTPGLIRLLRSHRSTIAQLRSRTTYSGHGRADIPLLSTTLGLISIQSLLHLAVYPALT